MSINLTKAITGYYYDVSGVQHGFLRARDGAFTTFDQIVFHLVLSSRFFDQGLDILADAIQL